MPMRITLDLPEKMPRYATDAGSTVEPGETDKDTGGVVDTHPPARWYNWLFNNLYQWTQVFASLIVSNWTGLDATSSRDNGGIIYHPEIGMFGVTGQGGTVATIQFSYDGYNAWTSSTTAPGTTSYGTIAIDSQYFIIAGTNADIYYSADLTGAWSTDTGPTAMTTIRRIETKYPDSDFIVAVDSLGAVKYASAGIGSSWSTPTPPSYTGSADCVGALWLSGTKFMILTEDGETKISLDDCASWANTTTDPDSILTNAAAGMAVNQDSGAVVAIGDNGTVNKIARTIDNGATWTESAFQYYDTADTTLNIFNAVYYCGGDMWLIVGDQDDDNIGMLVSYDDGVTFKPIKYYALLDTGVIADLNCICCSGATICVGGDDGIIYNSLSIPGTQA